MDILGFSPLIILLVVLGILIFMKLMKYAGIILLVAVVYLAAKLGWIPGIAPF